MKTIPLEPVFENEKFKRLNPTIQFYVVQAVYRLCTEDKEGEPIPHNLRHHLRCCESTYFRNKHIFREVLCEIMPEISRIRLLNYKRVSYAHLGNVRKAIRKREQQGKDMVFSDQETVCAKISPISSTAKPYHVGTFDHVAVSKAKESNETGKNKLFTDD